MTRNSGLTLPETLVALVVGFGVLFVVTGGGNICLTSEIKKGQMTQMLSNMRQLQYATLAAVLDGTGNSELKWPGNSGGTLSDWAALVVPDYLGTNDFCKLLSGPRIPVPSDKLPTANTNAVLVYAVLESSSSNSVHFTSANFTNTADGGLPPKKDSRPFQRDGFIVLRKDGTGDVMKDSAAGDTNKVGTFVPLCQ